MIPFPPSSSHTHLSLVDPAGWDKIVIERLSTLSLHSTKRPSRQDDCDQHFS